MLFVTNKIPESSYEDILFGRRFVIQHENFEIFVGRYLYSAKDFFNRTKIFLFERKCFLFVKIFYSHKFIGVANIRLNNQNLRDFAKIFVNIHKWYRPLMKLYEDFLTGLM